MDDKNKIVFEKLEEALKETGELLAVVAYPRQDELEAQEIAELRRIVLESTEPELNYFTTT